MDSKSRMPVWILVLATAAVAGLLIVAGCALDKNGARSEGVFNRIGGHGGDMIEPKRCLLRVAILSRPFGDPLVSQTIWADADEQIIAPAERRAWEVNGLRVGRIMGELPLEVEALLNETSPNRKVSPATFFVESGEQTLISISESVEQASLLLNRDNHAFGRDFNAASGFFRTTVEHDGAHSISLRLVPEIHHGPIQRTYQVLPNASAFAPQQFKINDGQHEETLRDLPVNLVVEPGQVVAIGCRPEQRRSLGSFLFTQAVAHSDQRVQKLILIWAARNMDGIIEKGSKGNDRPKAFKKASVSKSASPPNRSVAPTAAPAPEPEYPPNNQSKPAPAPAKNSQDASANQTDTKS
ncbi:MAG: hypothetical protein ACLQIB_42130 [Isosphaeraceae bacterium]